MSSVVAAAAGIACGVLLLQPWRSCPEIDDSSLVCPRTTSDTTLLLISVVTLAAALAVVVITTIRSTPAQPPAHRPAGPVRYGLIGETPIQASAKSTNERAARSEPKATKGQR